MPLYIYILATSSYIYNIYRFYWKQWWLKYYD